jgi:hypothetical protein
MRSVAMMERDPDLAEVILALRHTGGFSRRLDRWQQEGHEHPDYGNHDQQFDQGKSAASVAVHVTKPRKSTWLELANYRHMQMNCQMQMIFVRVLIRWVGE